ncbi:MAG: TPM domain-containing protein [Candidatus Eisenbacteria bacterium]|nr:TPM domain-containing protein [Candidatus Eisenbacteria bacterium]
MKLLRAGLRLLVVLAIFLAPATSHAIDGSAPIPDPAGYVNDRAGVIGEARVAELESFLDQLHTKTGAQFAVLTVADCEPDDPSVYKVRVFEKWGIGDKERRDGLLLLVAMKEREIRFETGYGLEGTLPDGWQSRMVRDLAVPRFRAGDPGEGITAVVLASAQRIAAEKGVTLEWNGQQLRYSEGRASSRKLPWWASLLIFMFIFLVVLPALNHGRRTGWGGGGWGPGGFGGGGWGGGFGGGGGGGFGGGGGGSFGGFGGGSSGGGGGGSSW